ncbi:hypothetical protein NKJ09_22670 [Mesorhizobium sp. M0189]|uniref:hypothetical protein n=1 Tax=Mesorhizobium sp. M0189 TaxID=2956909 RepID=UPI0033362969
MLASIRNMLLRRAPPANPELIVNGDFAVSTGWTAGGGWSIGSGVATAVSSGSLTRSISVVAGRSYDVGYTVVAWSAGNIAPSFSGGSTVSGATASGLGRKRTIIVAATGNATFGFTASGSPNFSIDDVSVKELQP